MSLLHSFAYGDSSTIHKTQETENVYHAVKHQKHTNKHPFYATLKLSEIRLEIRLEIIDRIHFYTEAQDFEFETSLIHVPHVL